MLFFNVHVQEVMYSLLISWCMHVIMVLRWTQTKRLVPVHGMSIHHDHLCMCTHAHMRFVFVVCNKLPFYVKILFRNHLYGRTLTFWKLWHRLSRMMDGIKRREAAEIHITSVSSLERIVVGWTPAEVLSSFLPDPVFSQSLLLELRRRWVYARLSHWSAR